MSTFLDPRNFIERVTPFVDLNIPVIPLRMQSKDPATKLVPNAALDATTDVDVIESWGNNGNSHYNVGAVARYDGYWFLDDDGGTLAQTLAKDGIILPRTVRVKTSRGYHYYFKHDDLSRAQKYGLSDNSGVIEIEGFKGEARCNNQYVVGFGSIHPDGPTYELIDDVPIVAAPENLLMWLQTAYAESETRRGRAIKTEKEAESSPRLSARRPTSKADTDGFKRLCEDVKFRPLERRMNAHEDDRFHNPTLKVGADEYCPIPSHGPVRKEDRWQPCFGLVRGSEDVFKCLACGWSGDVIKAVRDIDNLPSMYEAARVICGEEGLNFEDYFTTQTTPQSAYGVEPPSSVEVRASESEVAFTEGCATPSVGYGLVRPTLSEVALYGLPGDIIRKLSPQTETHPAGNLVELMLSMGNAMGRHTYYEVEDTPHYTNEFFVKVGESSKARKGTGKDRIRALMKQVDPEWLKNCNTGGIGSGEVVIHLMHDEMTRTQPDEDGNPETVVVASNIEDKRLTVSVGEFQGILAVCHKPDSLLSVIIRDGWDGKPLRNTVKNDPAHCMEPMLTIMADTTKADLSVSLSQADRNNGFANRFLWVYVYRVQLLPMGGEPIDWSPEVARLKKVLEFGGMDRRIFMDKTARDYWTRTLYSKLERDIPGLVGSLLSRASAHVMRLAMLYAIFDLSMHIKREHLDAALALWKYCEDSTHAVFGELLTPDQVKIMEHITAHGPANKKIIIEGCFKKNRKADDIQADLDILRAQGKLRMQDKDEVPYWHKTR